MGSTKGLRLRFRTEGSGFIGLRIQGLGFRISVPETPTPA